MVLKNKRVLLIAPRYFNYDLAIRAAVVQAGGLVHLLADRPRHDTFSKAVIRLNRKLYQPLSDRYFERDIRWDEGYDLVLIVIGESVSRSLLARLKRAFPNAPRVLYIWDSFFYKPALVENIPFFDRVFSFDKDDARRYGINFRPLFFLDDFCARDEKRTCYDLCFVGTVHADRYQVASRILDQVPQARAYRYFYVQSKLIYHARRMTDSAFRRAGRETIHFTPLPRDELRRKIFQSNAVVDIQRPSQSGLTIRTFETLAAGKKLITTNADIRNYDFFHPDNVLVVDRRSPQSVLGFLDRPSRDVGAGFSEKYSVNGWLREIVQSI